MPPLRQFCVVLGAMICVGLPAVCAAAGVWTYDTKDRGHPDLTYRENGKTVFSVGCGRAFAIHAVYPGPAKKDGEKVSITIASGKSQMDFAGEIDSGFNSDDPPNATHFLQWDLGFARQDPDLFAAKWKRLEARFLDLLDSGRPLTVSAEGQSYTLPPINVPRWKARFKKIC